MDKVLSGAERQQRWREKRASIVREAMHLRNASLTKLIADRHKRGLVTAKARRLAVQQLLASVDPEADAELLAWLRARVLR